MLGHLYVMAPSENRAFMCTHALSGHLILAIFISSSFFFHFKAFQHNKAKLLLPFVGYFYRERHLDSASSVPTRVDGG